MNKCKKCGEFISDEFETCYECKNSSEKEITERIKKNLKKPYWTGTNFLLFIFIINALLTFSELVSFNQYADILYIIFFVIVLVLYCFSHWNRAKRFKYGNKMLLILFFSNSIIFGSFFGFLDSGFGLYFFIGSVISNFIITLILIFKNATKP